MNINKLFTRKTGTVKTPTAMDRKFIDQVVEAHNNYRSNHQALSLSHSKDLSVLAQKWADYLASSNSFQHSNSRHRGESLGENIAMKWSSRADAYTGQEVTDQWYSEIKMYKFGGEPRSLNAGHFTQVVWKGSREIGVGKALTRDGKIIVVANYLPAGNMIGGYSKNVLPPKDGKVTIPQPKSQEPRSSYSSDNTSPGWNNNNSKVSSMRAGSDSGFDDFDQMRNNFFERGGNNPIDSMSSRGRESGGESRSTRTYTVTEGFGANKVTKIIEEETITKANGEIIKNRKETVKNDGDNGNSFGNFGNGNFDSPDFSGFGRLNIRDNNQFQNNDRSPTRNFPSYGGGGNASPQNRTQSQPLNKFVEDCLKDHNKSRSKHGVPPLKLSKDLSNHAQHWADHLAATDGFEHSRCTLDGGRIGENIACKWSSGGGDYSSEEVVNQWYSEISKHDYNSERSLGTGHYTQVVWKGSKELGIGKAKAAGGKIIVVANYRPAGNVIGSFRENVFPPK